MSDQDDLNATLADWDTERKQQQNATIYQGVQTPAPQAVKAHQIGNQLGLPPGFVMLDPAANEAYARTQQIQQTTAQSPVLQRWLTAHPDNTSLAQDDLHNLKGIEQATGSESIWSGPHSIWQGTNLADLMFSKLSDYGSAFAQGTAQLPDLLAKSGGLALSTLARLGGEEAQEYAFKHFVDPAVANMARRQLPENAGFGEKLAGATGGLATQLPIMLATGGLGEAPAAGEAAQALWPAVRQQVVHAVASMQVPAIAGAVDAGQRVFDQTGDSMAALKAGLGHYETTSAMGVLPLSASGGVPSRLMQGFVSGTAVSEAARQAQNAVMPENMQAPFDWQESLINGITMSLMAGVGGGRGPTKSAAEMADRVREFQAAKDMEKLKEASQYAKDSELRTNAPDKFKEFVRSASEEGLPAVYVKASDLVNAYQQAGRPVSELGIHMPEVAKDLADAIPANRDVRIPTEDYLTHIAGYPLEEAILPHIKTDPEGATFAEFEQQKAQQTEAMQKLAETITQQKATDTEFQASQQRVMDDVMQQFEASGRFSPEVARVNAALHRDFHTVLAQRRGVLPHESYADYGAQIVGNQIRAGGEQFAQPEPGTKLAFEVAPDPNDKALKSRWDVLPDAVKTRISTGVARYATERVLAHTGLKGTLHLQSGGYGPDTNPSMSLHLGKGVSGADVLRAARLLGHVLRQESVGVTSPHPFEGGERWGQIIIHGVDLANARKVYDDLRAHILDAKSEPAISGHTTADGAMSILTPLGTEDDLAKRMGEHLGDKHEVGTGDLHVAWPEKGTDDYGLHRKDDTASGASVRAHADRLRDETSRRFEEQLAETERAPDREYAQSPRGGAGLGERLRVGPGEVAGRYGKAQEGSDSVLGIHYSEQPRDTLSGFKYGTGLSGAEARRIERSDDDRLRQRIHFYVDEGAGIRPEQGVGGSVNGVHLDNLYNLAKDPLGIFAKHAADFNNVEAAALDAGFDGLYVPKAQGDQGVAVLIGPQHTQVPVEGIKAREFAQTKPPAPIFYSALSRAFDGAKMDSMPGSQWKAWLTSNAGKLGVKADEINATGVKEWLELQGKNKVSKADVAAYLKEGGVQVQEVTLRGSEEFPYVGNEWQIAIDHAEADGNFDLAERINRAWEGLDEETGSTAGQPKFGPGTHPTLSLPGGKNYRELLLTLPAPSWDYPGRRDAPSAAAEAQVFRSTHFDQPNILAHVRFNERTDAEGKRVLFLEELQSDWGQKGKKEGFKTGAEKTWQQLDDEVTALVRERSALNDEAAALPDSEMAQFKRLIGKIEALTPRIESLVADRNAAIETQHKGVPSAPFVTDTKAWTALALKRMIRYAAENGFDRVAWTTGEQQAARYDLSKQVNSIEWSKHDKTAKIVTIHPSAGNIIEMRVLPDGAVTGMGGGRIGSEFDGKKIDEIVGKDIADQVMSQEYGALSGAGLRVGGEGMKGYYDQIVPQVANDILKKLGGGKVGEVDLAAPAHAERKAHGWVMVDDATGEQVTGPQASQSAVESEHQEEAKGRQPGFDITPAMRDKVLGEGQPLFQAGDSPRGAYRPDTKTIAMYEKADLSTFVHESGHFFLDTYTKIAALPDAPADIRADVDTLLQWFGVKGDTLEDRLTNWHARGLAEQRPNHEQFAEGFEKYVMEGKAPSIGLQPIFQRMRAWLTHVYQSLTNLGANLTPEVRQVMDRMLSSEEDIKRAEAARVFEPMPRPEGVSDTDWAAYLKQHQTATDEAIEQLTARSVRDAKWFGNAKSKVLRDLQRESASQRREVRAEVEKQVDEIPVYKTEKALREAEGPLKISIEAMRDKYAGTTLGAFGLDPAKWEALGKGQHGVLSANGMDPDLAAEMHGYESGDAMVKDLLAREPRESVVDGLTDKRMLEEHGEVATPQAREDAANAAIHNEARAKFMATGLKILTKTAVSARDLVKAAAQAAAKRIADVKLGELNPRLYEAAEARANKEMLKAAPKDPAGAIDAQRRALLNNQLAKETRGALQDARKISDYVKKFTRDTIRGKIDPDIMDQIDGLLDRFDFRKRAPLGPDKKQVQLEQWVEAQKALGYTPTEIPEMMNPDVRMPYAQMTVGQARGLHDTVRSMEQLGRERRTITVDGQRMDVRLAIGEMNAKMQERGEKFTDQELVDRPRFGVDPVWRVTLDRIQAFFRSASSELKAQHFKANEYDVHQILGPFHRFVFERLFAANYRFLDLRREVSQMFREKAKDLGDDWQKTLKDIVDNHALLDNSMAVPAKRRLTRGDMIGIALHVGNESNFDKLVKGMGWEPTSIWQMLHDNMTAKDWQAVTALGEVSGIHWPEMVEMNRRLGNTSPEKIEPRPFKTKYGEMPGWYAPIRYDPIRSKLGVKQADRGAVNPAEGLFSGNYYRADTTTNGSLNARVSGYHDFVDLDWRVTERAIHDTVRDLAYREALVDTHKLTADKEFRAQFLRTYGPEAYKGLQTWMARVVNSDVGDERTSKLTAILAASRRAVVANGIAFRISTMGKHGGSAAMKSLGYFAGGGEKYFMSRVAAIGTNHSAEVAEGLAKSGELRARAQQQDRDFSEAVASIMEPESLHGKAERFGHAGVAWLDFLTAVPTFHAAYDWAITEGIPEKLGGTGKPMSERDAVTWANSIVREAHGTNIETGRSNLITNRSELVKQLTMLHGFMNNALGQHLDMVDKLKTAGLDKPEILARYMTAVILPAIVAGLITHGAAKEGESWLKWAAGAIAGEYAAMVPQVREAYAQLVEGWHSAGLPPWLKGVADLGKPAQDVVKAAKGEDVKHPIKDVGNAAGLILPGLGQLGATGQFLYDTAKGDQQPETVGDWARGVMSGETTAH